ncbi:Rossmann-fold NAD(P)-binding domain-containing protein [Kitasatospora cathayae]|uniref:hypothetical protein n=1 Tax=Kitasatospora cathayae TaxID=3004092 RepID=UPI0038600BAC
MGGEPAMAAAGSEKPQLPAALRAELGPRDVRVSAIAPGLTDTELGGHIDNPVLREQLGGMFAAIPALHAEDVADLIAYTVSRPGRSTRATRWCCRPGRPDLRA